MKLIQFRYGWTILLLCIVLVPGLFGQTAATGALTGTVTDSTGAVLPNATVTVTNTGTGQTRTVTTGANGSYRVPLLPPGTYRVKFEATGFKTAEVPAVTIIVTETPVLDCRMDVGSKGETVEVNAEAEAIQTTTAALGAVIAARTMTDIPLSTRNFTNMLGLTAGASTNVNNANNLGKGSQVIAVNGSGGTANTFEMDGAPVNNFTTNQTPETASYGSFGIPNPDSIQEFKIQTSQYDAGYGRNSGANVNVVTKSGTNQFHGTLFEFFRNSVLNANDFFLKATQLASGQKNTPPVLNQNQFGGVFGGPIKKDKLFFFVSFQETQQKNGATPFGFSSGVTLPPIPAGDRSTAAFRQQLGAAFCQQPTFGKEIVDGSHGGIPAFLAGTQVACDGSNINPVAMNLLNLKVGSSYYIPSPTTSGPVSYSIPAIYKEHQGMGNWDYLISSKHTLQGKYFYATDPTSAPFSSGLGFPGPALPGAPIEYQFTNHAASLKLTSALTSSFVNEARLSYQRNRIFNTNDVPFTDAQVGMTPIQPDIQHLTNIWFLPIGSPYHFDIGAHPFFGNNAGINQYQVADQISWSHGRHTLRVGGDIERDQWNWVFNSLMVGTIIFPTFSDFLIGLPGGFGPGTNGSILSNIISEPNFNTRGPAGGLHKNYRMAVYDWFVQDDFKVTPRLTLNLGLRWEYFSNLSDTAGRLSNFWLENIAAAGIPGTSPATGSFAGYVVPANYNGPTPPPGVVRNSNDSGSADPPHDNFAPRFGFSWQPTSSNRLAVRGGAGLFYNRIEAGTLVQSAEQSPPYAFTIPFNPGSSPASLANPFDQTPLGWNTPRWVGVDPITHGFIGSSITQPVLAKNFPTPVVYAWNLNIQYEVLPQWVLEVGYAGSHGMHQLYANTYPFNAAPLASPAHPINGQTNNSSSNATIRAPYLGIDPIDTLTSTQGAFKYNSLQTTLRKQLSRGLQFQAAYTFSRSFSTGGTGRDDVVHWRGDAFSAVYAPSYYYHPHRFAVNYLYQFPYAAHPGVKGKLLGGWSVSGVTVIQDGTPLSIYDSQGGSAYFGGNASQGTAISNAQFASGMGKSNVSTSGSLYNRVIGGLQMTQPGSTSVGFINPKAFTNIAPLDAGGGTGWGNSPFGIMLGPGQHNWDITLQKETKVGGFSEGAKLTFRAEFFNAFNHPQFSNPTVDRAGGTGALGQITSTSVNPRLLQFALKYSF